MQMLPKTLSLQRKILKNLADSGARRGDRLSTIREFARQYDVSYVTAQKAIKNLQRQGFLDCKQGAGVYVANLSQDPLAEPSDESPFQPMRVSAELRNATKTIAIILPQWVRGYGGLAVHEIIRSVTHYSDAHLWHIELINDTDGESLHPDFIDKITRRNIQGIVWLQPLPENEMNLMRLIDRGYEILATGRKFPRLPLPVVWADTKDIAEKIAGFAVEHGKRNIIIMSNSGYIDPYCREYIGNLKDSFAKRDIPIPAENIYSVPDRFDDTAMRERIQADYLREHPEAQMIILLHDYFYQAIAECVDEKIFPEPKNMFIFDIPGEFWHNKTHWKGIPIKKIRHPLENIGRRVIQHFEAKWLGQEETPENSIDLSVDIF